MQHESKEIGEVHGNPGEEKAGVNMVKAYAHLYKNVFMKPVSV